MTSTAPDPGELVAIDASEPARGDEILASLGRTKALLPGHFALQRGRHTPMAIRFRAIARDHEALAAVVRESIARATWSWDDAVVASPETAGFFLADGIARATGRPHAVFQTDLRRLPTDRLITGAIERNANVVIVNDVASTGKSLDPILESLADRKAIVCGILVFAVVGVADFLAFCQHRRTRPAWLVTPRWSSVERGPATCAGCRDGKPLLPIAEFS